MTEHVPESVKTVGRYSIVRELGRGGMAVVYVARQTELDRLVALKELAAFHASDASLALRFLREARVAGGLAHPNIVTVLDYFEHDGMPYIAMELVEHGSLRPYVGRLTLAQIGAVLDAVLAGLAEGERKGVVHRDLKPENLLVTHDGRVKIADYGIAKATSRMPTGGYQTATGMTVGTPGYMAPEQALGDRLGPQTDLYAVGCIAFELVTGQIPFAETDSPVGLLLRHVNEVVPPVSSVAPGVPPELASWIDGLLVRDPARRPASAEATADELERFLIDVLGPRWRSVARLGEPPTGEPPLAADRPVSRGSAIVPMPGPFTPPPPNLTAGGPMPSVSQSAPPGADDAEGRGAPSLEDDPASSEHAPPHDDAATRGDFVTYIEPPVQRPPTGDEADDGGVLAPEPAPADGPASVDVAAERPRDDALRSRTHDAGRVDTLADRAAEFPADAPREADVRTTVAPSVAPRGAIAAPASRTRSRARPFLLAAAGLAVVATAAAAMLAPRDEERPPVVPTASSRTLTTGPVSVRVPADWQDADVPAPVTTLGLRDPSTAEAPAGGQILVGLGPTSAERPALLAPEFVATLDDPDRMAATRERVTFGELEAYRYGELRQRGQGDPLTVYVAPTTAGVATVACLAPAADDACDRAARSLVVDDASGYALGPDTEFGRAVDEEVRELDTAVVEARRRAARAHTAKALVPILTRAERAYERAAQHLGGIELSPADRGPRSTLIEALRATARRYEQAAPAARSGNRSAYAAAAARVRRAEGSVREALSGLDAAGYGALVRAGLTRGSLPSLPTPPRPTPTASPPPPVPTQPPPEPTAPPVPTKPPPEPTIGPKPTPEP